MSYTIAVIPARSGSKSIKDKNIKVMNGKPMLAYSIEHAMKSKTIDRIIVSTDSEHYREIAIKYGAEVPFLRPSEISGDNALDIDVFCHLLSWLDKNENKEPDIFVHLRPTHPIRDPMDIDRMVDILINREEADSIRSMSMARQTPYKMWVFDEGSAIVKPLITCEIKEAYNAPRQILPIVYSQNACIDVMRSRIIRNGTMTGENILGYPMDYDYDIDTEEEFLRTERAIVLREALKVNKKLTVCSDIDGVIASKTIDNNYSKAEPIYKNILELNKLVDNGHKLILNTARGYVTKIDWSDLTKKQMNKWGVKYSEIIFGKPNADIYIDDKFFDINDLEFLTIYKNNK